MDKHVACYHLGERRYAVLAAEFGTQFAGTLGPQGWFTFEIGSPEEAMFLESVAEKKHEVRHRRTFIRCTGQALFRYPFHYLQVQHDRNYEKNAFMDETSRCPGRRPIQCTLGIRQTEKIVIDYQKSKNLDIMFDSSWANECVILISQQLKSQLEALHATGCDFVPCLDSSRAYTVEERQFSTRTQYAEQARYFQLVIGARTREPQKIGTLQSPIRLRCTECGTVLSWNSSEAGYFALADLEEDDFQICDRYRSDDGAEFVGVAKVPIISSRILRLFLDSKVRGLRAYLVDPPIKYGIVDIRG